MTHSPLLVFHICAGAIGLVTGATALFSGKGSKLHRRAGNLFFVSMLAMSASGAFLAFLIPRMLSVEVGLLTFYLVATAWLTVMRKPGHIGKLEFFTLLIGLLAGGGVFMGWQAAHAADGLRDGFPAGLYLSFASVALLAIFLDIKMLVQGGIYGAHRIARHLWRMCFALLIAAMSLFAGQEQLFPKAVRDTHLLNVPILITLILMLYWLLRVLFSKTYRQVNAQS